MHAIIYNRLTDEEIQQQQPKFIPLRGRPHESNYVMKFYHKLYLDPTHTMKHIKIILHYDQV